MGASGGAVMDAIRQTFPDMPLPSMWREFMNGAESGRTTRPRLRQFLTELGLESNETSGLPMYQECPWLPTPEQIATLFLNQGSQAVGRKELQRLIEKPEKYDQPLTALNKLGSPLAELYERLTGFGRWAFRLMGNELMKYSSELISRAFERFGMIPLPIVKPKTLPLLFQPVADGDYRPPPYLFHRIDENPRWLLWDTTPRAEAMGRKPTKDSIVEALHPACTRRLGMLYKPIQDCLHQFADILEVPQDWVRLPSFGEYNLAANTLNWLRMVAGLALPDLSGNGKTADWCCDKSPYGVGDDWYMTSDLTGLSKPGRWGGTEPQNHLSWRPVVCLP